MQKDPHYLLDGAVGYPKSLAYELQVFRICPRYKANEFLQI